MRRASKDLLNLTSSDRLWLDRKRRGETQARAAHRLGLIIRRLRIAESNALDDGVARRALKGRFWPPTIAEMCRLARRRSGIKLASLAKRAGFSHVSILALERVGDRRIVSWWRSRGFTFGQTPDKLK